MAFETPVLLLVYNRPEHTRKVLEVLEVIKPFHLFVVADGPRKGDEPKCEGVRALFENLNWNCQLETLFRDENLGCAHSVSTGITWFFNHVERGIILEDDCIPSQSFFRYCRDLLDHYSNDPRIMHIGANNFQNGKKRGNADYYFSIFNHLWGWATWKRAWGKFDFDINPDECEKMQDFVKSDKMRSYFIEQFENTVNGRLDSWGFRWTFSCWKNRGLSILPNKNLVSNIGFGDGATHTSAENSPQSNIKRHELDFPLKHPKEIESHFKADKYTFERIFQVKPALINRIKGKVKRKLTGS